jgi:hypothetical protein
MDMQLLNGLSAGMGFLAPILLAVGQQRSAAAAEVSLTLLEAGIRSLFTREGPVFGGLEQQRTKAARARRYFSVPGWCLLAGAFGLRLIAILSN